MKKIKYIITLIIMVTAVYAQHEHHNQNDMKKDTVVTEKENPMPHSYSLSLPMNRNGSGTAWLPDESPVNAYMLHKNNWMLMFHGSVFLRYSATDITKQGKYGAGKWDAPNWFMAMAHRKTGNKGLLKFSLMMSLDRITEGGNGYPLLYQSGETWRGKPLVNRQHPHDLFAELSTAYTHRLSNDFDITGYAGYPGEPALGPTAFMHRVSAMNNPDAPLSHHWQDASHITFGVLTLGLRYKIFKLEGSVFSGSEPDEERYGFDKPVLNSFSGRLSVNPNKNLSLQVSHGFIKSPEALEPDVDVNRTTVSIIHSQNFSNNNSLNTTIAWGLNNKGTHHKEHSLLIESNYSKKKLNVYGRYEFVQKDPDELDLAGFEHDTKFNINALTLGINYRMFTVNNTDISLGLQGSIYFTPAELHDIYGRIPVSAQMYLKLSPSQLFSGMQTNNHKH